MNLFKNLLLPLLFSLATGALFAQELSCKVTVNDEMVQGMDKRVFRDMEKMFQEFLNTRTWTEDDFRNEERIKCDITINITKASVGNFEATTSIQYARPVFNTSYTTLMFNYIDERFNFKYVEGQPINFNRNTYFSNLSSMLGFYAYIIIGMDYNSFGKEAGQKYFQYAQTIQQNAEQQVEDGWNAVGSTNNRYWLIENLMSQQFRPYVSTLYIYHRKVLDIYLIDKEVAQKNLLECVRNLKQVNNVKPVSIVIDNFLDCKAKEIVKLFKGAPYRERKEAYEALMKIDPTRTSLYGEIMINN